MSRLRQSLKLEGLLLKLMLSRMIFDDIDLLPPNLNIIFGRELKFNLTVAQCQPIFIYLSKPI